MSKTNFLISREQVLQHLSYNPETGELRYLADGFKRKSGDIVPKTANVVNILGSSYSKRKLIWFIQTGQWPEHKVDGAIFGDRCSSWANIKQGRIKKAALTADRLREVLNYDPETGVFTWKICLSSTGAAGAIAGTAQSDDGYVVIRIDRALHLAHRLAVLHVTGEFPVAMVDHKDMVKSNNRWSNLRPATMAQNAQNRLVAQKNNVASGMLGVYWSDAQKMWGAKLVVDGKQHHGGFHQTPELAHESYKHLKRRLHEFGML